MAARKSPSAKQKAARAKFTAMIRRKSGTSTGAKKTRGTKKKG